MIAGGVGVMLPPAVARYFRFALPPDAGRTPRVFIEWSGEMRLRPDARWVPFRATQRFTTRPPGFVWDARVRMLPVLPVRVRDSYAADGASMQARVAGVLPIVNQRGTPELAQSALARWLGEAVWFPWALLPDEQFAWEAVDDDTARATIVDGATSASADFVFASTGEVTTMRALRYRDVGGRAELTSFEGTYADWQRRDGVMVPGAAEVAWLLPEGRFAYWRGRPLSIRYD